MRHFSVTYDSIDSGDDKFSMVLSEEEDIGEVFTYDDLKAGLLGSKQVLSIPTNALKRNGISIRV